MQRRRERAFAETRQDYYLDLHACFKYGASRCHYRSVVSSDDRRQPSCGSCGRMVVLWEHICKWLGEGGSLGSGGWRLGIAYDFFWSSRVEVGSTILHRTRGGWSSRGLCCRRRRRCLHSRFFFPSSSLGRRGRRCSSSIEDALALCANRVG
jgi:hypothetical protein